MSKINGEIENLDLAHYYISIVTSQAIHQLEYKVYGSNRFCSAEYKCHHIYIRVFNADEMGMIIRRCSAGQ